MEVWPSREATSRSDTQEFSKLSWNLKVHYRFHKSPPLVPILSHTSPIHIIPSYFSKLNFSAKFVKKKMELGSSEHLTVCMSVCVSLPIVARQRLRKHVPAATNTKGTI
jgi:hypothetical protein